MATINKTYVLRGRVVEFIVKDAATPTPNTIVDWENIRDGNVVITEEISESVYELEDGSEMKEQYGRKLVVEFSCSEVDTEDIEALMLDAGTLTVKTATGGANGTGRTFSCSFDKCYARIADLKTQVTIKKSSTDKATLPYSITDNPAS